MTSFVEGLFLGWLASQITTLIVAQIVRNTMQDAVDDWRDRDD